MNPVGKVWLIGAGCGAEMLTRQGQKILAAADVVVHDRLVADAILLTIPASVKLIDAGKSANRHPLPQNAINQLLIAEARAGKNVARLKGGDPFLFGRGGEEMAALNAAKIPCEIIPGVSSAFAATASAAIPLTHRGASSAAHLLTWRDQHGRPPAAPVLRHLAAGGGTAVIFMAAAAKNLGDTLIAAGFAADTPVAIIENGATPQQKVRRLTLAAFASAVAAAPPQSPALIVVGEVAAPDFLHAAVSDTTNAPSPLRGLRLLVTPTEPLNAEICELLAQRQAVALPCPLIKTARLHSEEKTRAAVDSVNHYDWFVFTSVAGVDSFFAAYRDGGGDWRQFYRARFAVSGDATAAALRRHGFAADLMPTEFNGKNLAAELTARIASDEKILRVRGNCASPELAEILRENRVPCADLEIYATLANPVNSRAQKIIRERQFDGVIFASPSAVTAFANLAQSAADKSAGNLASVAALCLGETTAAQARKLSMTARTATAATAAAVAELAADWARKR